MIIRESDIKPGTRFENSKGAQLVATSLTSEKPMTWRVSPYDPQQLRSQRASDGFPMTAKRILELLNSAASNMNDQDTGTSAAATSKRSLGKNDDRRHTPRSSKFHQTMATARSCR